MMSNLDLFVLSVSLVWPSNTGLITGIYKTVVDFLCDDFTLIFFFFLINVDNLSLIWSVI